MQVPRHWYNPSEADRAEIRAAVAAMRGRMKVLRDLRDLDITRQAVQPLPATRSAPAVRARLRMARTKRALQRMPHVGVIAAVSTTSLQKVADRAAEAMRDVTKAAVLRFPGGRLLDDSERAFLGTWSESVRGELMAIRDELGMPT